MIFSLLGLCFSGWDAFPWSKWKQARNTPWGHKKVISSYITYGKASWEKAAETKALRQKQMLPRGGRQSQGLQKEIIDLEETVCLPRYQCGRQSSGSGNTDQSKSFTATVNQDNVSG